ncbi:MAG: hypothetical protein AAF742_04595 [Pseudomonadota bacterium]
MGLLGHTNCRRFATLFAVAAVSICTAQGQSASEACAETTFRQLDFWVGEWDVSWALPSGGRGSGTNTITKDEYGSCVIFERFSTPSLVGMSVSTFDTSIGKWRQTWVDNQGGYYAFVGGPTPDKPYKFEFEQTGTAEGSPGRRMIWENVKPNSLRWRWQQRANAEEKWQDAWVIDYQKTQ